MTPINPSLDLDYNFSIIASSTGPFVDKDGAAQILSLGQTISNNIFHVGCFCANFTGLNDITDVPLYVNEKYTDVHKVLNNP